MRIIFHIDVNAAFLSWTAAYRCQVLGEQQDLRDIPAAIAGEKANRHGIILAKSLPAKRMGVKTGEPIFQAVKKCPQLVTAPPDYALYTQASRRFIALLRSFTPLVEQYSIDEAWADMTGTERLYGSPVLAARTIKQQIREQLGFTVNIGISSNKLLAKIAGDFEKPDRVHTLFPEEIPEKLWPLPVRELFLVGRATEESCATSASVPSARWPRATRRCCSAICTSPACAFGTTPMAAATARCCRNSRKTRAMATPRPCLPM